MPLGAEEPLARFIVEKSYFRADRTVKHSAFMPSRQDKEVSVFRIFGLDLHGIWDLGNRHVANPRGKELLGRADIQVSNVIDIGLIVVPDDDSSRHSNIRGWPDEGSKQKLFALQLANKAMLHLTSDPSEL